MKNKYIYTRSSPILPIGLVNLKTGHNAMFDSIWQCWERDNSICILFRKKLNSWEPQTVTYKVVVTASNDLNGVSGDYPMGSIHSFIHDQGRYNMGDWEVIACYRHNEDGHSHIAKATGKSSISFATYK